MACFNCPLHYHTNTREVKLCVLHSKLLKVQSPMKWKLMVIYSYCEWPLNCYKLFMNLPILLKWDVPVWVCLELWGMLQEIKTDEDRYERAKAWKWIEHQIQSIHVYIFLSSSGYWPDNLTNSTLGVGYLSINWDSCLASIIHHAFSFDQINRLWISLLFKCTLHNFAELSAFCQAHNFGSTLSMP